MADFRMKTHVADLDLCHPSDGNGLAVVLIDGKPAAGVKARLFDEHGASVSIFADNHTFICELPQPLVSDRDGRFPEGHVRPGLRYGTVFTTADDQPLASLVWEA